MASVIFAPEEIKDAFNEDGEFRLCARFWTGPIEFGVGETAYRLVLQDGVVTSATEGAFDPKVRQDDDRCLVRVFAPTTDWENLLKDPAPPFYLDYFSASFQHSFVLDGDPDTLWAYYPAIRRTSELFRRMAKGGGRADA